MKRFVTLLLVLALILPAAALAKEPDCCAAYTHAEMLENDHDAPFFSTIMFAEDHTCYYCDQIFYSDRPGTSNAMMGSWKMSGDDIIITLGRPGFILTLSIIDGGDLMNMDNKKIYEHVNAIWVSK